MRHALRGTVGGWSTESWTVRSAGIKVRPGTHTDPMARQALAGRGIQMLPRSATQLTSDALGRADLVLTASRAERAWLVQREPSSLRKTFTLLQFTRMTLAARSLPGWCPPQQGSEMLAQGLAGRSLVQPVDAEADTVADPYGKDRAAFEACASLIERSILAMLGR